MTQNEEHRIMEQLNKFLKNFKATVTAKLRLIESLLSDIGQYSHQTLLSKIANKQVIDHSDYLEDRTGINGIIGKLVYRFCLRINQFLQYRLCQLKNRNEIFIKNQVASFEKNLNNMFKQINEQSQLGSFIKQIIIIEQNFSFRLLQKISQNANISKDKLLNKQSIAQVARTFRQKFPVVQQIKNVIKFQNNDQSFNFDSKNGLSSPFMNKLNKRQNYKKHNKNVQDRNIISIDGWNGALPLLDPIRKNTSIQSTLASQNLSNKLLPYDPQAQKIKPYHYTHARRRTIDSKYNPEDIIIPASPSFSRNLQSFSVLSKRDHYNSIKAYTNKQKYVNAISNLMQLEQHPYGSYSNDYLMAQLTSLNKKNQIIMDKYRKKYNKKKTNSQKCLLKKVKNSENEEIARKNSTHKTINNERDIKKQQIYLEKSLFADIKKKKLPVISKKLSCK